MEGVDRDNTPFICRYYILKQQWIRFKAWMYLILGLIPLPIFLESQTKLLTWCPGSLLFLHPCDLVLAYQLWTCQVPLRNHPMLPYGFLNNLLKIIASKPIQVCTVITEAIKRVSPLRSPHPHSVLLSSWVPPLFLNLLKCLLINSNTASYWLILKLFSASKPKIHFTLKHWERRPLHVTAWSLACVPATSDSSRTVTSK